MTTSAFATKLNKKLGGRFVYPATDLVVARRYTSGSIAFDSALGGGFPGNSWTEVIGLPSAGKTATTFKTIAANQKEDPGFMTFWVAGERFDRDQAEALGVDLGRVMLADTQIMEHALESMIDATASKEFDAIVLDSYPALLASDEGEKGMDEVVVAPGARLVNKFVRKIGQASQRAVDGSERPFVGIFINQWRDKIGGFSPMGPAKTTPGGNGKDYLFYTRVEVKKDGLWLTEKVPGEKDPRKVGQTVKLVTIKNKSAAPQRTAKVDFYFASAPSLGFKRGDYDTIKEYSEIAISLGVVERAGAYYRYSGQQWLGQDGLTDAIRSDTLLREALKRDILDLSLDRHVLDTMEG